MADEKPAVNVMGDVLWVLGIFAALVALWFFSGGPGKADLRGLFLAPPAPLGTGEAYGPQIGSGPTTTDYSPVEAPPMSE